MTRPGDGERPLDVDGFRGWYLAAGDGPPVVLLASPIGRAKSYRPTVRHLSAAHRVYTVEMPGSGRGARLPRPWGLGEYARWSAGALEALGVTDATVVGHSHSGAIPILMAADNPGRIGRIAVVDSIGAGGPHSFARAVWGRLIDAVLEWDLVLTKAHHVLGNFVRHPRNAAAQTWVSLRADVTADAERVAVPALVAWGARDHSLPPRCAGVFARHLPRPTAYLSPRGSHDWIIQRPAEFVDVLARFIRESGRA